MQTLAQLAVTFSNDIKQFFTRSFFPFLTLLSAIVFLWGVAMVTSAKNSEDKDKGGKIMVYGLVGVAVFTILWGVFFFSLAPSFIPNPALIK